MKRHITVPKRNGMLMHVMIDKITWIGEEILPTDSTTITRIAYNDPTGACILTPSPPSEVIALIEEAQRSTISETKYRGKPISQLTDDEFAQMVQEDVKQKGGQQ